MLLFPAPRPHLCAGNPRLREKGLAAFLYAFDLLELNGADMRREPIAD
jgi:hypothetical protein